MNVSKQQRRRLFVSVAIAILVAAGQIGAADSDTVVVVVSAQCSVSEISALHLADIYLGRTNRFPNGEPAEPIDLAPGSAVRDAFYQVYLGRSQATIKAHWSRVIFTGRGRPPRDVASERAVRDLVAGNPLAIGYVERHVVDRRLRIVRIR